MALYAKMSNYILRGFKLTFTPFTRSLRKKTKSLSGQIGDQVLKVSHH